MSGTLGQLLAKPAVRRLAADLLIVAADTARRAALGIADQRAACADPTCDGDLHYTGRRHPDTNEDIEAGPCPLWAVAA